MPKLNSKTAEEVETAEDPFKLLDPGLIVTAELEEVSTGEGDKGPYWMWDFKVTSAEGKGRSFREFTSLSGNARWRLQKMFEAFGVSADTDTDDLIGKPVKLQLGTRTVTKGPREGELTNTIDRVFPIDDSTAEAIGAAVGKKDDKPLF